MTESKTVSKTVFKTLRLDVERGIARLTLNRPDRLNAMTNQMVREAHDALVELRADPTVRVLVLTGEGKGFCPGADLRHFTDAYAEADEMLDAHHFRVATMLHELPAVTLAAVNGACAGAGLGWALACDLRVAAASARFNTAFLDVAVAGDMGGPWTLSRLVGASKARELYFLPGRFDAAEALRIGLVARVFDDVSFRDDVEVIVDRLAAASPTALLTMKANFLAAERLSFADYIDLESERHLRVAGGPHAREAFRAFVEKRAPTFDT